MTQAPRKALITGASSGIGAEYARQLAAHCEQIIITGRRQARLELLAGELRQNGQQCRVVVADLTTTVGVAELVETIRQQGPLDYLVNNAETNVLVVKK